MLQNFKHGESYPQLLQELPAHLKKDLEFIKSHLYPHTSRAYLVGGAVRDLLRRKIEHKDIPIVDLDIEVYGISPTFFEKIMQDIDAKGVGKSFFVYKYKEYIDISLPRIESKVGIGHKAFEVKVVDDEKEASKRRDFRMNALMLGIFDGKFLDFWQGVDDIINRRIAIIDEEKFKEDSLRVLRAVQFSSRFGYKIEPKSSTLMQEISLDDLSKERIFWEFEKLFKGEYIEYGLFYLKKLLIDQKIFGSVFKWWLRSFKEMRRSKRAFEIDLYKFYFLYILAKNEHKAFLFFLDKLQTPNEYYKIFRFQKSLPKSVTERFIAAMALRFPIKNYLGNYSMRVKTLAKEIGLWEQKFSAVTASELMKEGLSGPELGRELRRRNLEAIRKLFKGRE